MANWMLRQTSRVDCDRHYDRTHRLCGFYGQTMCAIRCRAIALSRSLWPNSNWQLRLAQALVALYLQHGCMASRLNAAYLQQDMQAGCQMLSLLVSLLVECSTHTCMAGGFFWTAWLTAPCSSEQVRARFAAEPSSNAFLINVSAKASGSICLMHSSRVVPPPDELATSACHA